MLLPHRPFCHLETFGDVAQFLGMPEGKLRGKKNGETRVFWKPSRQLKSRQRIIQRALRRVKLPPYVCGSVRGKSILSNAAPHVGKKALLKVDVKDFFPTIRPERVRGVFRALGCGREAARILTVLTTWKWQLPQGAPTSPALANLVALEMAGKIAEIARSVGATYTVYVDDHTLSGPESVGDAVPAVRKAMHECGFRMHTEKVDFKTSRDEHVVTGVRVDAGIDVPSAKFAEIEAIFAATLENGWSAVPVRRRHRADPLQSLLGRYIYVRALNPVLAHRLASMLRAILDKWGYPSLNGRRSAGPAARIIAGLSSLIPGYAGPM